MTYTFVEKETEQRAGHMVVTQEHQKTAPWPGTGERWAEVVVALEASQSEELLQPLSLEGPQKKQKKMVLVTFYLKELSYQLRKSLSKNHQN